MGVGATTGGGEGGGGGMFVPSVREKETVSRVRGLKFTGAIVVSAAAGEAGSRDRGRARFLGLMEDVRRESPVVELAIVY